MQKVRYNRGTRNKEKYPHTNITDLVVHVGLLILQKNMNLLGDLDE